MDLVSLCVSGRLVDESLVSGSVVVDLLKPVCYQHFRQNIKWIDSFSFKYHISSNKRPHAY